MLQRIEIHFLILGLLARRTAFTASSRTVQTIDTLGSDKVNKAEAWMRHWREGRVLSAYTKSDSDSG